LVNARHLSNPFPSSSIKSVDPSGVCLLLQRLEYFTNIGVKDYKIDRGEEGEMPGT